jgi:ParB family chromosome partitioning protein
MFKATSTSDNAAQELRELPVDAIEPNLSQPRRYFDEAGLENLAGSIGERGVLQPIVVRETSNGKFELVVGERRWRAAKLAGLQSIPALLSTSDDGAALEAALIENMVREDLNPVEEARACATLVRELGLTLEQVGRCVGRSRVAVSNLMRLLDLSAESLELLERGELSEGHGRALLMAKNLELRRQLAGAAVREGWSVRTLEVRARAANGERAGDNAADSRRAGKEAERTRGSAEAQDLAAPAVAKAWGDVLGVEVEVRTLSRGRWRVEMVFNSLEAALASAGRQGEGRSS